MRRKIIIVLSLMALGLSTVSAVARAEDEHAHAARRRISSRQTPFAFTEAEWKSGDHVLTARGTAPSRTRVTVVDAADGSAVAVVQADRDGQWAVWASGLGRVPCRLRASAGEVFLERDVSGAPDGCSGAVATLTAVEVSGPSSVQEGGTAAFTAIAVFSDGARRDVSAGASWGTDSASATVAAGTVQAGPVSSDTRVTVTASFTSSGATRSGSAAFTIIDATASLSGLAIAGPADVNENAQASYQATASFSDGTSRDVTGEAAWSVDGAAAGISGGVLTAYEVSADQSVTVTASWSSGGVSSTATAAVTVHDSIGNLHGSHVGRFTTYEGTKTCLTCHESEAASIHASVHYQWQGDASESKGLDSSLAGKLGGINDFCIYPDINWIGKLTNLDGNQVDGGCSKCHAGLGLKPSADATTEQLENVDCLVCHSASYKRTVGTVAGQLRWVPDTSAMAVPLMQAAVDITLPSRGTCLNCHTKAGGGNNFKRGDIEEAHRNATAAFDVHMASRSAGGAGLQCLDCHRASGHRIAGRGVDMRERDLAAPMACTDCHPAGPHTDARLNMHTARVACTVCHIPTFANGAPTDMMRDWSAPGDVNPATRLYEPHSVMASHVVPEYRFFNGTSQFYQFGSRAVPGPDGRIMMAGPLGSIQDPGAKIVPLKHHTARQPMDAATGRLLPLKIGIFFQTGNEAAAAAGAEAVGWTYNGQVFADTERFLEINHEVQPASSALACASCHGGSRLDFAALGYTPKTTRNGRPLCGSCHEQENDQLSFEDLHRRHVDGRHLDCAECHTFSKAN